MSLVVPLVKVNVLLGVTTSKSEKVVPVSGTIGRMLNLACPELAIAWME